MWQAFVEFTQEYLDVVGAWLGIILAVPVFWTWWEVLWGRERRRRRWQREAMRNPGSRPGVLIVDLLPGREVHAAVRIFCQQHEDLRKVPGERYFCITRDQHLRPEDLPALAREIRERSAEMIRAGVDTVHYFHAGPAVLAALVGAEFANGRRVLLYQHGSTGYAPFGPLRFEE